MSDAPFIGIGAHHRPVDLSNRIALDFTTMLRLRADETHHRDVNHGFADEPAGNAPAAKLTPCPAHIHDIRMAA